MTGRRVLTRLASCLVLIPVFAAVFAQPASAAAGTWAGAPYNNGVVCAVDGGATVPLVSWNLGSRAPLAFVASGLSMSAGVPVELPPVGGAVVGTAIAGTYGFTAADQLAALAYLISHWGSDPSSAVVGEVAELVAEATGSATGASCLTSGDHGLSRTGADAMWAQAQQLAGPYHLAVSTTSAPVAAGAPISVRAALTSAAGRPVAGATVTFAGGLQPVLATTDAAGIASANLRPAGLGATSLTASYSAPIGLSVVTAPGTAVAVTVAAPTEVRAVTELTAITAPDPVVATSMTAAVTLPGIAVGTAITVTGLNGHTASATLAVVGPLPIPAGGCATISTAQWKAAATADAKLTTTGAPVAINGDGVVSGPPVTPATAGCYSTTVELVTLDANPNVTGQVQYPGTLTVPGLTMSIAGAAGGLAPNSTPTITVTVANALGATGSITGSVLGPLAPVSGSCSGLTWSTARSAATVVPTPIHGDGVYASVAPRPLLFGCYAMDLRSNFTFTNLGSVALLIPPTSPSAVSLALTPTLQVAGQATWVSAGQAMKATIGVFGSLTQTGELTTQLRWLPPQELGCVQGDWSKSTPVGPATRAATQGDLAYQVLSAPTTKVGCYELAVSLELTANRQVRADAQLATVGSVFLAADPDRGPFLPASSTGRNETVRTLLTTSIFGLFLALGASLAVTLSWRQRRL